MTYKEVISYIKESCLLNVSVNDFYEGSVYEINGDRNVIYPVAILTPSPHSLDVVTTVYNFSLFYVDRLTGSRDNKIDVQSEAIQTLKEITNRINDNYDLDITYTLTATVFKERFSDECAGAYISLNIETDDPIRECYVDKDLDCECK